MRSIGRLAVILAATTTLSACTAYHWTGGFSAGPGVPAPPPAYRPLRETLTECVRQTDPDELPRLALIADAELSAWQPKGRRTVAINTCMAAKGWYRLPDHIYSL